MVHSGFKLKGYEVIDFDYLQQLLRGGHFGVFDVFTQEVISTFSEIEEDFPRSILWSPLSVNYQVPSFDCPSFRSEIFQPKLLHVVRHGSMEHCAAQLGKKAAFLPAYLVSH